MPEVTMSMAEYLSLIGESSPSMERAVKTPSKTVAAKSKRKGKPNPKLSKALKVSNAKARKKNGDFKKGYNQSRVMKEAHRMVKK